ncbi:MAG: hypothetical protein A2Y79_12885 [Deltaproteobacteria bacterium RBG_13_43_22]|nr:MAG: hypothetical protein A2Y79_12885 [Deltaproteobacteria bacterium RBG_13_43_22]
MKVLLINPPDFHMIKTNFPDELEGEEKAGYNPPLGLLYVASYALSHTDFEIEVLDTQVEELTYADIEKEIVRRNPDVVGIQTMTFTLIDVMMVARIVKKADPKTIIVLGGPHVNIYPEESIEQVEIDFLILGEGEVPFTELLNGLNRNDDLSLIKGLVFKKDGKLVNTGSRPLIDNLDELPHPARSLVPVEKYWSVLARSNPVTTIMTSRGCPYKCIFCDRPHLGKSFRFRSAKNVVDEMEECIQMGIAEFILYDDTFTVNRQRVLDICAEIVSRKLKIFWDVRARVNLIDLEMMEKMKSAGCDRIHFGVESGNNEILKVLKKGITLNQVETAFQAARKAGLTTLAYFMLGNPFETREQILETIGFSRKIRPDFVHISLTSPFPATELYKLGLERGIIKRDYWKEFAENPSADFLPPLWEENLNRDELFEMLRLAYKKFYFRPTYIFQQILKTGSWNEFKRKAKAGLKMFKI